MMWVFIATIAVILFVVQAQIQLLLEAPSTSRTLRLVALILAIAVILFQRFGA